jgi:uncharacterized protein (TIGR02453 family)
VWPPEAIEFLRELEANNDSDWFRANRKRYDRDVLGPARELAESVQHLGKPHYFRPYNNLRFRPGPPLKENVGVAVGYGGSGGYYFDLSLDGLIIAGGLYHPATDQLERFRAAINDERRVKGFEHAVAQAEADGLSLAAPELKRAPRGYSIDHPRIDRLRLKRLTVSRVHPLGPWLHKRRCDQIVRTQLEAAQPLVKWLEQAVGPSTRPRRD